MDILLNLIFFFPLSCILHGETKPLRTDGADAIQRRKIQSTPNIFYFLSIIFLQHGKQNNKKVCYSLPLKRLRFKFEQFQFLT